MAPGPDGGGGSDVALRCAAHLEDDAPHCIRPEVGDWNAIDSGPVTDSIETADLDGDGLLDVIATDDRIASAIVLYNRGPHQSPLRVEYPFGPALYDRTCLLGVSVADVDRDGKLDLVTNDACAGLVQVLLQTGPRMFGAPIATPVAASGPGWLADINRDGVPDLVRYDGVQLGNGDGTFQPAAANGLPPIDGGAVVAVGDLDEDGIADIAITNVTIDNTTGGYKSSIVLAFGVGDGSFTRVTSFGTGQGTNASSLVIADVDGDHHVDLVVLLRNTSVGVFAGHGDGTFAAPVEYSTGNDGWEADSLAVGDVDRDGKLDVVVGHGIAQTATVLHGQAGGFAAPSGFYPVGFTKQLVLADINGDGNLDLLAPSAEITTMLAGRGDGTFTTGLATTEVRESASVLAMADLDGDGDADAVVATSHGGTGPATDSVAVWLADQGTFVKQAEAVIPSYANAIALADFDGDGRLDIAVANDEDVHVFLRDAAGQLSPRIDIASATVGRWLKAYDVDEDGHVDMLVGSWWGGLKWLRGRGDGTFDVVDTGIWGDTFAAEDLDCDGHLDVVALDYTGARVYRGDGTGTFVQMASQPTGIEVPGITAVGDLDGDGRNDLVVSNPSGFNVLLGTTGLAFVPAGAVTIAGAPSGLLLADVDRDGRVDAIVTDRMGGVAVLPGKGDGSFDAPQWRAAAPTTLAAAWADVNGDGVRDLVTLGYAFPPAPGQLAVLTSGCAEHD